MNSPDEQLWNDLGNLILTLDWSQSGPIEAASGSFGHRIMRSIVASNSGIPEGESKNDFTCLWNGFDSLLLDYRISRTELLAMYDAYDRLRGDGLEIWDCTRH